MTMPDTTPNLPIAEAAQRARDVVSGMPGPVREQVNALAELAARDLGVDVPAVECAGEPS